ATTQVSSGWQTPAAPQGSTGGAHTAPPAPTTHASPSGHDREAHGSSSDEQPATRSASAGTSPARRLREGPRESIGGEPLPFDRRQRRTVGTSSCGAPPESRGAPCDGR